MKKGIIIRIVIIILLVSSIIIFKTFNLHVESEKSENVIDYNVISKDVVDGLKFELTNYVYHPATGSKLVVKITNIKKKKIVIDGIKLNSKDEENNTYINLDAKLYVELDPNENIDYVFYSKDNIVVSFDKIEYIPNIIK